MTPRLPRLWFFTDPARTSDPVAISHRLPRGSAIVLRHFGDDRHRRLAQILVTMARRRGLVLLIGADVDLARRLGAQGVHLPERDAAKAGALKRRFPHWIVTAAAHSASAMRRASAADAIVLSPIYPSRSPSAGAPLGVIRAARMARESRTPVIALGGVTRRSAPALCRRGFAGIAGINMFAEREP